MAALLEAAQPELSDFLDTCQEHRGPWWPRTGPPPQPEPTQTPGSNTSVLPTRSTERGAGSAQTPVSGKIPSWPHRSHGEKGKQKTKGFGGALCVTSGEGWLDFRTVT